MLEVTTLPFGAIQPNPWNPNKQSERQFEAEVESIQTYGFVLPIIVRPADKKGKKYELVDGEHRVKALDVIRHNYKHTETPLRDDLVEIVESEMVPCIVLDLDDATARKLTVILNETRGKAQLAPLAQLLEELSTMLSAEDLLKGLPYTGEELSDILQLSDSFDASTFDGVLDDDIEPQDAYGSISCTVTPETETKWRALVARKKDEAPKSEREGIRNAQTIIDDERRLNGWVLEYLLSKEEQ